MSNKHPHHDMIVAWAADTSRVVQCWQTTQEWLDIEQPNWNREGKYRFKPEPKPDVMTECKITRCYGAILWNSETDTVDGANLRLTFDGETGQLKSAEVLA